MNLKKAMAFSVAVLTVAFLPACQKESTPKETVSLTLWSSKENQELMQEITDEFVTYYKDEADIDVFLGTEPENTLAENIKAGPESAADVFHFADDQVKSLIDAGILLPITQNTDQILLDNGGKGADIMDAITYDDQIYAYPITASNGYFLYYNDEYLTEQDVLTLDSILAAAEQNNKKFSMEWSSGWYLYSFFGGAGLTLDMDESNDKNICNWNATDTKYTGVDVANAMLAIAEKRGFANIQDEDLVENVQIGNVIAAVSGPWNEKSLKECWGEHCRATKLPTYTLGDEQIQMASFMGYKLLGVNSYTKEPEWAMKLAEWIASYDNQIKRFESTGECPSNIRAASEESVQASLTANALTQQLPYSIRQNVGTNFWVPATTLGTILASGNPDNNDLQELLDEMVEKVQS